MTETEILSQLPPGDWEATPSSVRELVLRLMPLVEESLHRRTIARYQALIDKMFVGSLSSEEQEECKRLGEEIDAGNAPFYRKALLRA